MTILFIFGKSGGEDPRDGNVCRLREEDKRILNELADAAYAKFIAAARDVASSFEAIDTPNCIKVQAQMIATLNVLLRQTLMHRSAHGAAPVQALADRPDALEVAASDINVIITSMLKGMDPANEYVYQLVRVQK